MDLRKKYKQLFEGKTRSNDSRLLNEIKDKQLDKLFKQSLKASVRDGEDKLYDLS